MTPIVGDELADSLEPLMSPQNSWVGPDLSRVPEGTVLSIPPTGSKHMQHVRRVEKFLKRMEKQPGVVAAAVATKRRLHEATLTSELEDRDELSELRAAFEAGEASS